MSKSEKNVPEGIEVRYTVAEDAAAFRSWFNDEETLRGFPMEGEMEIDDAVMRWIAFYRFKCSLTILKDGVPCGIATLYLQPYHKIAHQCEFGIVVRKEYRNQGIGSYLMQSILHLAKTKFKIELIHLQVYADNPAIKLYEKFGFKEFSRQNKWIKEKDGYAARIFMERFL